MIAGENQDNLLQIFFGTWDIQLETWTIPYKPGHLVTVCNIKLTKIWHSLNPGAGESSSFSKLSVTAVNQHPNSRHQVCCLGVANYKSSDLINGAVISKMTISILIRGPEFRDWDHSDPMKKIIDVVIFKRSWCSLNGSQLEPASSSCRWLCTYDISVLASALSSGSCCLF